MVSLGWGIAAYTKANRNTRLDKHKMTISGLVLQTVWRAGMIGARVLALALVATVIEGWLLLYLGELLLHCQYACVKCILTLNVGVDRHMTSAGRICHHVLLCISNKNSK